MPDLPAGPRKALGLYWGAIQHAAAQHLPTADLWEAIRGAAADAGLESPGVSAIDVSIIRGYAGSMTRATEALAASEPGLGITADMIAEPPWARSLAEQNLTPRYQVTYARQALTADGLEVSQYSTSIFEGTLPDTIGELEAAVLADAVDMLAATPPEETPTTQILGVSDLTILRV